MSKWLRRDNENHISDPQSSQTPETFQPPVADTATGTAHVHSPPNPNSHPRPMVGYTPHSNAHISMDIDQERRNITNGVHHSNNRAYDSSRNRSSRDPNGYDVQDRARALPVEARGSRTPRQTQGNGTSTSHYPYQSRPGSSSAANSTQHFTHPSFNSQNTPQETLQPRYPPPTVSEETAAVQAPPQRRPAYLLHRDLVIGKGSYGQVCIASRGEPEGHSSGRSGKRKKFACKCVMLRNDPKYIAKLQEEVNVLRELRGHQNVIRLYDVFCVDNELFIITELGRGGDLFHLLTTHPKHGVTESYAAKTVVEMLSAVAFLHSRLICHRDLKLENWVLESGKDVWSPLKLIDFGLSTHFTPGQRLSRVVGSSYYVAPEVLKKSYTEACDLWSLGVIVYMLLSGAPPFYGKNDEAIKASIVQGEYSFPHELFRDVSDEAMAFVSTLLSYNTDYRYTAQQALTHPWLATNVDPDALQRAKDGAMGVGILCHESSPEPMQL
jgi:calcium/calmodulin-dependent protein kinase I